MPTPRPVHKSAIPTSTDPTSLQSAAGRLDNGRQRIDALVATLRNAPDHVEGRLGRRVDSLRAQEAELWTRLREQREKNPGGSIADLNLALGQFQTQIDIAEARLSAELASDAATFAAAVTAELRAWDGRLKWVEATAATSRNGGSGDVDAAIKPVRERQAEAEQRLGEFMAAGSNASAARVARTRGNR